MLGTAGAHYAAFFRMPDVARLLAMAVVARMPIGTVTLGMLLHVRALTGSFAVAGATVGSYLAASAVTAPIVGRFIDRRGPHLALAVTGIVSPSALFVLWIAKPLGLSPALGAFLLLATPQRVFTILVPGLLGFATVLFAFAQPIGNWLRARAQKRGRDIDFSVTNLKMLLPVSFYGGYFGAGVGVLLLAVMSIATRGGCQPAGVVFEVGARWDR